MGRPPAIDAKVLAQGPNHDEHAESDSRQMRENGKEGGIGIEFNSLSEKAEARFDHLLTSLGKVKMYACITA
ncbi:MAG: hypothetical protein ACPIOQ_55465 [Promethearchaeia archaeon]